MKLRRLDIEGLYLIELTRHEDDRGFFARTLDDDDFHGVANFYPSWDWFSTFGGIHCGHIEVLDSELFLSVTPDAEQVVADQRTARRE